MMPRPLSRSLGSVDWLFAYGSLLPPGRAELPPGLVPCTLRAWRRSWGVAMDNAEDLPGYKHYLAPDGVRPAVMVAFLDIAPAPGAAVNGIAIPVDPREFPGLDARERNYERIEVTGELDRDLDGRVWTYRGLPAARERAARGSAEGRLVVADSYRDRVLAGFTLLGGRARFESSTGPAPRLAELAVVHAAPPAVPRALS
jgi:hypothetical protein